MKLRYLISFLAIIVFLIGVGCQKVETNVLVSTPNIPVVTEQPEQPVETPQEIIPKGADVKILRGGFDPEAIEISAGSTVTFKNTDSKVHLVVVTGGDRSPSLQPGIVCEESATDCETTLGDTWDLTLEEKGEYEITDAIFKFSGTIVVK